MALILQREITLLEIRIIKRCTLRHQPTKDTVAVKRVLVPFQIWQRHDTCDTGDTCDTCETHLTTLLPPPRDDAWMSTIHPPSVCDVRLISANSAYKVTSKYCSDMSGCHRNCCCLKISRFCHLFNTNVPIAKDLLSSKVFTPTHENSRHVLILWLQIR